MIKDGSRSAYGIGIRVNSTGFLAGKFLPGLVLAIGLVLSAGRDCAGNKFCGGGLCG